jgi:hypothetical protein
MTINLVSPIVYVLYLSLMANTKAPTPVPSELQTTH